MSIAEKFEVIADAVYDKGTEHMRLAMTNAVTDNNTRVHYNAAFQYENLSGFEFAYTIKPRGYIASIFYMCASMAELPKPLDFSEIFTYNSNDTTTYRKSAFAYCSVLERIPDLNMKAIGGLEEWFIQCKKLHTIELLRVHENTIYTNTFMQCDALENIAFDGVIGQNINLSWSPLLTIQSLNNIIDHLKEFPSGSSANITLHANSKALLGDEGLGRIEAKGWSYA